MEQSPGEVPNTELPSLSPGTLLALRCDQAELRQLGKLTWASVSEFLLRLHYVAWLIGCRCGWPVSRSTDTSSPHRNYIFGLSGISSPNSKPHCYDLSTTRPPGKQRLPLRRQGQRPDFFGGKVKVFTTQTLISNTYHENYSTRVDLSISWGIPILKADHKNG